MNELIELAIKSGNWGAFVFGIFGLIITGLLGFLLRRPLMKQTVANEEFRAVQQGFLTLLAEKDKHILFLETQREAQHAYEAVLIQKLRECEERTLFSRRRT